ncbi:MAG TPA: hypothetical protein VLJ21_01185 [Candidatus Binatia bacterium]|nr:hypothetical protein [Candidatus Binatia bacterium]
MYFKRIGTAFITTFRELRMPFVMTLAYEILFVLVVTLIAVGGRHFLGVVGTQFSAPTYVTESTAAAVQSFFLQSMGVMLATLAAIIVAYIILQGFAWLAVVGKKPSGRFFVKFFLLNAGWLFVWAVVGWFFIVGLKSQFATVGLITLALLFLHLTALLQHASVSQGLSVKQSIAYAFSTGIGKLHRFIVPYLLAVVLFLLWSQVWRIVPAQSISGFSFVVLACVIFAPFLAWYKFYLHKLLV